MSTRRIRIAVNCSIDLIRSRPSRESAHDAADLEGLGSADETLPTSGRSPERLMLSTEVQDRINAAMSSWSARERAAFMLRQFEGTRIGELYPRRGLDREGQPANAPTRRAATHRPATLVAHTPRAKAMDAKPCAAAATQGGSSFV